MRAGATTPLAEARGKELEVVRIGLLGGFSVLPFKVWWSQL